MSNEQNSTVRQLSIESLLFNDILEEKSLALRKALEECLRTQPYSLFNSEFTIFLKRVKRIGRNASNAATERNASNASTSTSMAGSSTVNSTPNPIPDVSNANINNANSSQTIGEPYIEPNLFRPDSGDNSQGHFPVPPYTLTRPSEEFAINNNAASEQTQNQPDVDDEDDEGHEVDDGNETDVIDEDDENIEVEEKYLNKWRVKLEEIKSDSGSTFIVKLNGVLVEKDSVKVLEKDHRAGILKFRKNKHLVQTDKGLYNLIGPICGGAPNNFFQQCLRAKGIPRTWKHFLTKCFNFRVIKKKTPKKKVPVNLNKSSTRSGTIYNNNDKTSGNKNTNKKRKLSGDDRSNTKKIKNDNTPIKIAVASTSKKFSGVNICGEQKINKKHNRSEEEVSIKNDNIRKELLIASASKKFNRINTPAQLLKYKFHQKLMKTCGLMPKSVIKTSIK